MADHNTDSVMHVIKTTSQWNDRAVQYWVIPRGCLCVELTLDNQTKLKVGEGNKYYEQLPYVTSIEDLSDYYTKEEINIILKDLNFMSVKSTKEYDNKESLPVDGNILGDVRFVKSTDLEKKPDPDTYLWNGNRWILVGNPFIDIDLSQYVKQSEFQPVKNQVDEMYPISHWHNNKQILDKIEQPFTNTDKNKLDSLHNYDDTEIRNDITELEVVAHTHSNKPILDTITESSILSSEDRVKFDSLHNYDDTEIRNDIAYIDVKVTYLEYVAHTHDNKSILDQIEQPFTTADKEKLDSLHNNDVFLGTDGMFPGVAGLVPAPKVTDIGKVLSSSGVWVSASVDVFIGATADTDGAEGIVPTPMAGEQSYYLRGDGTWSNIPTYSLPPATTSTLGGIKVGNNLTIDQDGVLSATGSSSTEYIAGDGISFVGTPEYTDMNFNMSQFITSINQGWVAEGTKSTTSSTITLTNTSSQGYTCYTGPYDDTSSSIYTINVSPNTEYELRYTVNDTSYDGGVVVFENRNSYNVRYNCLIVGSSLTQAIRFTTTANVTALNFRVEVRTQYGSITFSNIQLYEVSYPSTTPQSINAKLGDGLSFDSNDAIAANHIVKEIYNNNASTSSTVSNLNFNIGDYKYLTLVYSVNGYGDFVQQIPCVATTVSNFTITYGAGPSGGGSSTMLCGYAQISGSDGAYSLTIGHAAYSITFGSSVSVDDASTVTMYIKGLYGNS